MANIKELRPTLPLYPATAIVVGSVVGSGIFVSSASMSRALQSGPLLLAVWVLAGVLTLFGALTQCELVGQLPRTGGLYEYLHKIYGEKTGFFYGWANFTIAGSGAIAALAFVFAHYLAEFMALPHLSPELEKWPLHLPWLGRVFPLADLGAKCVGAALIVFLTGVNILGVRVGAALQSISTSSKVLAIVVILGVALIGGSKVGHASHFSSSLHSPLSGSGLIGLIALAMSSAFWAYDGWGNLASIAGEVKDPAQTVPRAIVLGTLSCVALYVLLNVAYLFILPVDQLAAIPNDRVASGVVSAVVGPLGGKLVATLVLLSVFDTLNSIILTNGRVYYAMARRHVFWERAGAVHERFQTPHVALICQGAWSLALLFSGSFELIIGIYVFVNWALYALMACGVFVLRRRHPDAARPFKTPGYPWVPLVFILSAMAFVLVTLVTDIREYNAGKSEMIKSLMGVALVFCGLPFYFFWRPRKARLKSSR